MSENLNEAKVLDKTKTAARKLFFGLKPEEVKEKFRIRAAKKKYKIEERKGQTIDYSKAKLYVSASTAKDSRKINYSLSVIFPVIKKNGKQKFFNQSVFIYNRFSSAQDASEFQQKHGKDFLQIFKTVKAEKKPKKNKSLNESMEYNISEELEDRIFETLENDIVVQYNAENLQNYNEELLSLEESLDREFEL